jgi:hypothetical protein
MAVQPQRPVWTDERLDDLSQSIREGFARNEAEHLAMREESRDLRAETRSGFAQVDARFQHFETSMREGFAEQNRQINALHHQLNSQLNALQRTMITAFASLAIAIIGAALISNSSLF